MNNKCASSLLPVGEMEGAMIKVCGMRDPENIRAVEALGVQWMGFIFWPGSKRFVSERPSYLPTKCKRVGVFVDADIAEVLQKVEEYALDVIQLHGSESPEYISQLKNLLITLHSSPLMLRIEPAHARKSNQAPTPLAQSQPSPLMLHPSPFTLHPSPSIIKAFNIATPADLERTSEYENIANYFLFDTKGKSVGGNGEQFDWSILNHYHGHTPFLLSGGIGPDDADRVKNFLTSHPSSFTLDASHRACSCSEVESSSDSPRSIAAFTLDASPFTLHPSPFTLHPSPFTLSPAPCIGLDLNSRFETSPGVKDIESLHSFLTQFTH